MTYFVVEKTVEQRHQQSLAHTHTPWGSK